MANVTPTICVDGKKHSWKSIGLYKDQYFYMYTDFKWCKKCGCMTKFRGDQSFDLKRCKEDDGSYNIEIPKVHRVW